MAMKTTTIPQITRLPQRRQFTTRQRQQLRSERGSKTTGITIELSIDKDEAAMNVAAQNREQTSVFQFKSKR